MLAWAEKLRQTNSKLSPPNKPILSPTLVLEKPNASPNREPLPVSEATDGLNKDHNKEDSEDKGQDNAESILISDNMSYSTSSSGLQQQVYPCTHSIPIKNKGETLHVAPCEIEPDEQLDIVNMTNIPLIPDPIQDTLPNLEYERISVWGDSPKNNEEESLSTASPSNTLELQHITHITSSTRNISPNMDS